MTPRGDREASNRRRGIGEDERQPEMARLTAEHLDGLERNDFSDFDE